MRALLVAAVLLAASSGALGQTLACNPKAPRTDPGTGFAAFGANEQALGRGGNEGPAWEWALGPDTEGGAKVQGSLDWVSGRSYGWTLAYSGSGGATLELRDGAAVVLSLNYPSGMEAGNALELQVATNASIGAGTSIAATVSSIKGQAVSGSIAQTGNNQESAQRLYFYYPPMSQGFSASGTVSLSYASLPTGSRVDFRVRAGTLPCTNQAPSVSIAAPAAGALLQAGSALSVNASAADADGTVTKVELFANGVSIGEDSTAPYSIQWTPSAGASSLTAVATDNAGDETTSAAVAVTVNAQPAVALTSPAPGSVLQAPGSLTLAATASDADGTVTKVEFFQGATLLGTASAAPYSLALSNLAAGSYTFTAVASDERGGVSTSAPLSVLVNAPPTVSLTSPAANASFNAPADIVLTANAADPDGTLASVAFYYGDTLITTLSAAPYSFTWSAVPAGSYSLTARATDNHGAVVSSAAVNITVSSAVAQLYFIHADHLNSPRLIANQAGQTVWRWDQQEPFGVNVPDENPSGLGAFEFPMRFPGQYFDKETNLHYNYFRDYDPSLGRYEESDPIGLHGGINTYLYVGAAPLNEVDVFGLANGPAIKGLRLGKPWPIPNPYGSGKEACRYYDDRCKASGCPPDTYACNARKCCESFDDTDSNRCTRKCLIEYDERNCSGRSGADLAACRFRAHQICYLSCLNVVEAVRYAVSGAPAACRDALGGL